MSAQPSIEWQHVYRENTEFGPFSIIRTSDSGFVIAGSSGWSNSFDTYHLIVVRTDANGALLWETTFDDSVLGFKDGLENSSIVQTSDGGFVIAATIGNVRADAFIVKLTGQGGVEWQKAYGGSLNDEAASIVETTDHGYVVAGQTNSTDGDLKGVNPDSTAGTRVWVFKLDSSGSIVWQRTYGGSWGGSWALSLTPAFDGGYAVAAWVSGAGGIVTGFHTSPFGGADIWVLKLDSIGALEWEHCYGGSGDDYPSSIIQTSDRGYAVLGSTESRDGDVVGHHNGTGPSDYDLWLIKIDSAGKLLWQDPLGGSKEDLGYGLVEDADGGYVLAGMTESNDGDVSGWHDSTSSIGPLPDMWVVKTDAGGKLVWQKCLGGTGFDEGTALTLASDLGIVIAGNTNSLNGDVTGVQPGDTSDFWVVKLAGIPCTDIRVSLASSRHSAHRGDTVLLAVVSLDSSARALNTLDFTIGMNTDLLTPIGLIPKIGVFAGIQPSRFMAGADSLSVRLQLPAPMRIGPDTLCVVACIVNVTDTFSTPITLGRVDFSDPPMSSTCLTSVLDEPTDSAALFTYLPDCGDNTLASAMNNTLPFTLESVSPNPSRGGFVVELTNRSGESIGYELSDAIGNARARGWFSTGKNYVNVENLPSGVYFLRLTQSDVVQSATVLLER